MAKLTNKFVDKFVNEMQQNVSSYHIFQDFYTLENYGLIVSGDNVYAIGENSRGQLGLGHNENVDTFQKIPELTGKMIIEFIEGNSCMFGKSQDGLIYGWGGNAYGQLGRGYVSGLQQYLKPQQIMINEKITKIVCGEMHALALSTEGNVYAWGDNTCGQIACPLDEGVISVPKKIEFSNKIVFKTVYCYLNTSSAITNNNELYFWGENTGYFSNLQKIPNLPQLIPEIKTKQVILMQKHTQKNTSKGKLYYLWNKRLFRYKNNDKDEIIDEDIEQMAMDNDNALICMKKDKVHILNIIRNKLDKTDFNNFEEYFIHKYGANFSTQQNKTEPSSYIKSLGAIRKPLYPSSVKSDSLDFSYLKLKGDKMGALSSDQNLSKPTIIHTYFDNKNIEDLEKRFFEEISSLVEEKHRAEFSKFFNGLDSSLDEIKLTVNNLKESINIFEMFRRQHFKSYDPKMILFISVNFAFNILISNYELNSENNVKCFKIFHAYIEFMFAELKYLSFSGKIEQCKDLLDKTMMDNHKTSEIITKQLLEFFRKKYNLFEKMVIIDELYLDDEQVCDQVPTEFDVNEIIELAENSEIRFSSAPLAVYHWLKHSVEDLYETNLQICARSLISPKEYLREVNGVLTSDDVNISKLENTNIYHFTLRHDDDANYVAHQRNVKIKWDKSIELLTYYKNKF